MSSEHIAIIGAGLAGCECALALAASGIRVTVYEMKPHRYSPAHTSPLLGELVCSNSLRSDDPDTAVGMLKKEMRRLRSAVIHAADRTKVPAGKALAVDRDLFAADLTRQMEENPLICLVREEVAGLDDASPLLQNYSKIIVAAGPLAGDALIDSLRRYTGNSSLYFFDAIAPIVDGASINMQKAFWGSRYLPEDKDYLNCPMTREEYFHFRRALLDGQKVAPRSFEKELHFEGCMPIESLAERGEMTLAFGPFKPVGFVNPYTGERPFAIVQLRTENANKTMFNLVGCQTKLTYAEQTRIFRLIPGLEDVEFIRFGSMHRNTFVDAPAVLNENLSFKQEPRIFLAGQLTGVEGYVESAACGLWLGKLLAAEARNYTLPPPPVESALGALLGHLRTPAKRFQPSNVQFGLMPPLQVRAKKAQRKALYAERGTEVFNIWFEEHKELL